MVKKILKKMYLLARYVFCDTRYFFLYAFRYFQNNYRNSCKFYTDKAFADLIASGKSIIRVGDGEIGLLHYFPIRYQRYSRAIRQDLLKIITTYGDHSAYVLMIPLFVNYTNTELKKINRFLAFRQLKVTYELVFNKTATYFDQLIFYKDGGFEKFVVPHIQNKQVVIVTNQEHIRKIKSSARARADYQYITCPDNDAYEARMAVQQNIIELITKSGLPKKEFIVLMSAGLAKTAIYDLAEMGYQVLDIGKGLESYYAGISIEKTI